MCVLGRLFSPHRLMRKTDLLKLGRNMLRLTGAEAGEKVFPSQHTEVYRETEMPPVL